MKRILTIFMVSVVAVASLMAAPISSPAATVFLTENKVITKSDLNKEYQTYKSAGYNITEAEVLESMINREVFMQGAKRDGYYVDDRNVELLYASQKANIESQLGSSLTDDEFSQLVVSQYGSVDEYKTYLREQGTMNAYVPAKKADMVNNVTQPTDRDITNWYRQNQTTVFSQPYMVRVSAITFDLTDDGKKLADDVYAKINAGTLSFEKAVQLYSTDTASKSKGGDVGWLIDAQSSRQAVGDEFVETVMELDVGDISGVIATPGYYAIAKVTASMDAKILGLNDNIAPDQNITVKEYIRQGLLYQNSQLAFMNAYQSLLDDLKSQAKINRFI